MTPHLRIYGDGGARGNPGPAAAAFVVYDAQEKLLQQKTQYLGETTNNVAEYQAVLLALKWVYQNLDQLDFKYIVYFLDSELAVKQLTGEYKIKSIRLKPIITTIKNLEKKLKTKIYWRHVSRTKNKIADRLVNQEIDRTSVK